MLKIVFVIIGSSIGAGFSSGREIYLFFSKYGYMGILGIVITGIMTSLIIYKVLMLEKVYEINNYNELLERINWKYEKLNKVVNLIVNTFLLVSFYIMIAGFSGYMKQAYSLPVYLSSIVFVIICYIVFKKNIDGIIKANEILVPILIGLMIIIGMKNIPFIVENANYIELKAESKHWLISSLLYTSYNSIVLVPVLIGLRKYITSKKQVVKISIISGCIITVLSLFIFGLLLRDTYFISQLDMPIMYVAEKFGIIFKYLYGFVVISAIFTSAISTGYSFLKNVTKRKSSYDFLLIFICLTGILISNIGFSKLVGILYPTFGVFGLLQILLLAIEKNS